MQKPRPFQSVYNQQEKITHVLLQKANADISDTITTSSYYGLSFSTPMIMAKLSVVFDKLFDSFLILCAWSQKTVIEQTRVIQPIANPLEEFATGLGRVKDYNSWRDYLNGYDWLNRKTPDKVKIKESYFAKVRFSLKDAEDQMGQLAFTDFFSRLDGMSADYLKGLDFTQVRNSELANLIGTLKQRDLAVARIILDQEIANRNSADGIAKALQNYVYRDYRKTWTSPADYYRAQMQDKNGNSKAVSIPAGSVSYQFRRIARTEINRTYRESYYRQTANDPLVIGYKWNLSAAHNHNLHCICEKVAEGDPGHDSPGDPLQGLWEDPAQIPDTHPNCMCFPTTERMDFATWLDKMEEDYLEPYETDSFEAWAKDGGVIKDEDGKPKIIYHGTNTSSQGTQPSSETFAVKGHGYYTDSYKVAQTYVERWDISTQVDQLPADVRAKLENYYGDKMHETILIVEPSQFFGGAPREIYYEVNSKTGKLTGRWRYADEWANEPNEYGVYEMIWRESQLSKQEIDKILKTGQKQWIYDTPEIEKDVESGVQKVLQQDELIFGGKNYGQYGSVKSYYLKMQNPIVVDYKGGSTSAEFEFEGKLFGHVPTEYEYSDDRIPSITDLEAYIQKKYPDADGIILKNVVDIGSDWIREEDQVSTVYITFDNSQRFEIPQEAERKPQAEQSTKAQDWLVGQDQTKPNFKEDVFDIKLADLDDLQTKTTAPMFSAANLAGLNGIKALEKGGEYQFSTFAATSSEGAELERMNKKNPTIYEVATGTEALIAQDGEDATALLTSDIKYKVTKVETLETTADELGWSGKRKVSYVKYTLTPS